MNGPWKVYWRLNGVSIEETTQFIRDTFKGFKSLFYFHPNGKEAGPHIHGLVFNFHRTDETCRDYIKEKFNLTNKTHFGVSNKLEKRVLMTEELTPRYITYMSKGKYDPVFKESYDDEYLVLRKQEWKEPITLRCGDLTVIADSVQKKDRITLWQISDETYTILLQMRELDNKKIKATRIVTVAKQILHKYHKLAHNSQLAHIVQDVYWKLNDEYADHQMNQILKMCGLSID